MSRYFDYMDSANKNLASRGEELYKKKIQKQLLVSAKGKFAAIDVISEEYFIADTLIEAFQKAKKKYPNHQFHFVRVGHSAAVTFKHRTQP